MSVIIGTDKLVALKKQGGMKNGACTIISSGLLVILGSLSSDVFERRMSTGSEVFSLLTCLDDVKFVFI